MSDVEAFLKPSRLSKDKNATSGEPITGFVEGGKLGPFKCGNCVHQRRGSCHHPVMMEKSKRPKNKDGSVPVDHDDCCEFQRRPGE